MITARHMYTIVAAPIVIPWPVVQSIAIDFKLANKLRHWLIVEIKVNDNFRANF